MSPRLAVSLAVACAAVGAALVLAIGVATGWVGSSPTQTVVVTEPERPVEVARTTPLPPLHLPRVAPLIGNQFDPARLYALRSPGVVTIYAEFAAGALVQGSG